MNRVAQSEIHHKVWFQNVLLQEVLKPGVKYTPHTTVVYTIMCTLKAGQAWMHAHHGQVHVH